MELWIRSQDKDDLVCTKRVYVKDNTIRTNVYETIGFTILGQYSTKERALEVLDEIEKYLINNTFAKKENGLGETIDIIPNPIFVYEMPKE